MLEGREVKFLDVVGKILACLAILVPAIWAVISYVRSRFGRLSWRSIEKGIADLYGQMSSDNYTPSVIICIGRSGSIVGSMLSGCFERKMTPIVTISFDHRREHPHHMRGKEYIRSEEFIDACSVKRGVQNALILAVDIMTGSTMKAALRELGRMGVSHSAIACLYWNPDAEVTPTFRYRERSSRPRYPWMSWPCWKSWSAVPGRAPGSSSQTACDRENRFNIRLYLVRHAKTSSGEDVFCGARDYDLTPEGIRTARDVAMFFQGRAITTLYTSPLGRARKTAKLIHEVLPHCELRESENIREIGYGDWEGLSHREANDKNPSLYEKWNRDPVATVPPNGESPTVVLERMLNFLKEVEQTTTGVPGSECAAVLHKGCIRILLAHLLGEALTDYRKRDIKHCAIVTLTFDGHAWYVRDTNPFSQ